MPQTFNVGARSIFVTATAWVFIVLAGLTSLSALVQNAAMASLMPQLRLATDHMPLFTERIKGVACCGCSIPQLPFVAHPKDATAATVPAAISVDAPEPNSR